MRPLFRDLILFAVAAAAAFFVSAGMLRLLRSPSRGLPYHDDFAGGSDSGWVAYDGNWNVQAGMMVNESNERGAKLVTGSPYWANYAMDADVSLSSTGEAGLIARVSDAEQGVDSYSGIYAGLRVRDEALVVGIADHSWNEIAAKPLPSPIVSNAWYHIRMEVRGCDLTVFTWPDVRPNRIVQFHESLEQCPKQGKIGLRSYDSGGQWKNIMVTDLKKRTGGL
ncbi:MAG TPA: family 16 glycoside hydrolase [Terracidiphilus sp.]|nr:family 16 glycoside hydrolase [Terracidiphilus sp.]